MIEFGFAPGRVTELPNSVAIPESPREPNSPEGAARLLYCGRLSTEKSLETLLEAAALLEASGTDVCVDLVGAGDPVRNAEPGLRDLAGHLDVEIDFHGACEDVTPFYRNADVFVLPSVSEGMSNSLLEALSHGLVVVASDIPENRAVVEHDVDGLLFRQGDVADLANTLRRVLIRDEAGDRLTSRLRQAARATAVRRFSVEAVVDGLTEIYAEVLSGRRGSLSWPPC